MLNPDVRALLVHNTINKPHRKYNTLLCANVMYINRGVNEGQNKPKNKPNGTISILHQLLLLK